MCGIFCVAFSTSLFVERSEVEYQVWGLPVVLSLTSISIATFLFDAIGTKRKVNKREMHLTKNIGEHLVFAYVFYGRIFTFLKKSSAKNFHTV